MLDSRDGKILFAPGLVFFFGWFLILSLVFFLRVSHEDVYPDQKSCGDDDRNFLTSLGDFVGKQHVYGETGEESDDHF